jgi:hypothetical protein
MEPIPGWEWPSRFWRVVVLLAIAVGVLFIFNDWRVIARNAAKRGGTTQPAGTP